MSVADSLKVGGAVLIIGFALAFYERGNKIEQLTKENEAQAETIRLQEKAYQTAVKNLEIERQAVLTQKAINDEIQQKRESTLSEVRTIIKTQPCSSVDIDKRALKRLRE